MRFRHAAGAIVILVVTTAMAQTTSPAPTVPGGTEVMQRQGVAGRRGLPGNQTRGPQAPAPLRQRVQDLENTLSQMHLVLKQMQDKAAKSKAQDALAKANLDMWTLMVGHLDKELQDLKVAVAQREDMEARRAALYKQADAKTEAQAEAARAAEAAKFGVAPPTPAPSGEGPAGQAAPGQSSTPPANNTSSPN